MNHRADQWASEHGLGSILNFKLCACPLHPIRIQQNSVKKGDTWDQHCASIWAADSLILQQIPRLHSAPPPPPPPGRWVRSILRWGVSLTRVYTVIPLKEQTPQTGQNEWAQARNFSCYTWKSAIHWGGGGRPSFLFTHKIKAVSDPTRRVEPYKFGWAQKVGQFVFTLRGKRAGGGGGGGSDPASGVRPRNRSTV